MVLPWRRSRYAPPAFELCTLVWIFAATYPRWSHHGALDFHKGVKVMTHKDKGSKNLESKNLASYWQGFLKDVGFDNPNTFINVKVSLGTVPGFYLFIRHSSFLFFFCFVIIPNQCWIFNSWSICKSNRTLVRHIAKNWIEKLKNTDYC